MNNKNLAIVLILIMTISSLSMIMVKTTFAQITSKPYVPEFTLKIVVHSYDVAPIATIDPFTGKNVTSRVGYNVQNMSIELIIKNQAFTPYKNSNGTTVNLYYIVDWKGHFENDWRTSLPHYLASDSDYTVLTFGVNIPDYANYNSDKLGNFPIESQLDFQVKALIGYYTKITVPMFPNDETSPLTTKDMFHGEISNLSNIQTVTIPDTSSSASPNPTPTPSVPEFSSWTILLLVIIIVSTSLLGYFKKYQKKKLTQSFQGIFYPKPGLTTPMPVYDTFSF
jgi:hypothetical protein